VLIFGWWQFEAITAFCILLALDRLLAGRDVASAVATGLGVMVKLVPLLILPVVALSRPVRKTVIYAGIVALVVTLIALPLLVAAPDTARASFASPLAWSSWETVWALIDGNGERTGVLGPIDDHFSTALATTPRGNPSRVPDGLKAIGFGVLTLALLRRIGFRFGMSNDERRMTNDDERSLSAALRGQVAKDDAYRALGVLVITYVVFVLWSKGWSPQWQVILSPLILLMLPDATGIGFVLIFGLVNLAEYPVLISRGLWGPVAATIILRTLLLVVLLIELLRRVKAYQPA
jgi:hypothetical protein